MGLVNTLALLTYEDEHEKASNPFDELNTILIIPRD